VGAVRVRHLRIKASWVNYLIFAKMDTTALANIIIINKNKKMEDKKEEKIKHESIFYESIFEALSALQGELKSVKRTKEVKFKTREGRDVNFWFAPLDEIMDYLYPLLGKHGLSVRHELSEKGVECVLTHETYLQELSVLEIITETPTGERKREIKQQFTTRNELRSGVLKIKTEGDMKDVGGQITYARRYTLALVLGIATEEDNDVKLEEERKESLEKFALKQAKKNIAEAKTKEQIAKQAEFMSAELKLIEDGKAPKLGFTKEQYDELMEMCIAKGEEFAEKVGGNNKEEK